MAAPLVRIGRIALVAAATTQCSLFDDSPRSDLVGCLPEYTAVAETSREQLVANDVPDASLVLRVDGEVVCRLFFGAHTDTTKVFTVSAAKWLTAATLMTVVDQGLLGVSTKVSEVYPEAPALTASITLSQLLSHTSGLLWFSRCMGSSQFTLQECAEIILESDVHFDAGTGFFYAGPPFTVAGGMAERVTGKTWAQVFQANIAGPLGLTRTSYGTSANPALSEGFVVSTADEYAKFCQMLLDGGTFNGRQVLSEGSVDQMRTNRTSGIQRVNSPRGEMDYGLGAWLEQVDAAGLGVVVSSPGAGGFFPLVDYDRRMVLVFAAAHERAWDAIPGIVTAVRSAVDATR
jgi:CubicO group peptidase (beta-lactamase class C family)